MSFQDFSALIGQMLLAIGGGSAVTFGLSSWLGKVWAERLMIKEKAKHDEALEILRSEIRKQAFEAETRFSRLDAKRAEVIAEIFGRLVNFMKAAEIHLPGKQVNLDNQASFARAQAAFLEAFEPNEIYLSPKLCSSLLEFSEKIAFHAREKCILDEATKDAPPTPALMQELGLNVTARFKFITDAVPRLKEELTAEFRRLLGVPLSDCER